MEDPAANLSIPNFAEAPVNIGDFGSIFAASAYSIPHVTSLPKNELGVPAPPNHGCDAVVEVNSAVAAEFLGENPDAKFKVIRRPRIGTPPRRGRPKSAGRGSSEGKRRRRRRADSSESSETSSESEEIEDNDDDREDGVADGARSSPRAPSNSRDSPAAKRAASTFMHVKQLGTLNVRNGLCRGVPIEEMVDSAGLLRVVYKGDGVSPFHLELFRRFSSEGYILLRGIIPRSKIEAAFAVVDGHLRSKGTVKPNGSIAPGQNGMTVDQTTGDVISGADLYVDPAAAVGSSAEGWRRVGQSEAMRSVLVGEEMAFVLRALAAGATGTAATKASVAADFSSVTGIPLPADGPGPCVFSPAVLSPYTWLRVKSRGEMTPEHADYFHFKRMTPLLNSAAQAKEQAEEIAEAQRLLQAETDAAAAAGAPVGASSSASAAANIAVGAEGVVAQAGGVNGGTDAAEGEGELGDEICCACGGGDRPDEMLLCEECDAGFHMSCLSPPLSALPEGDWFCSNCSVRQVLGTAWVPLQDLELKNGVLTVQRGSHKLPNFDESIGIKQLPRSFRTHMLDAPWLLPDRLAAGDIVLFDLRTIHSTTVNQMNRFRISADLRWCLKPNRPNFGLTAPSRAVLDVQMPM